MHTNKGFFLNSRAQTSFEYLLMVTFGILLVVTAAFLLNGLGAVANAGKAKLLTYRDEAIANLLN